MTSAPEACICPVCYRGIMGIQHRMLYLMIKGIQKFQDTIVAREVCWENITCKIPGSLKALLLDYYIVIVFFRVGKISKRWSVGVQFAYSGNASVL